MNINRINQLIGFHNKGVTGNMREELEEIIPDRPIEFEYIVNGTYKIDKDTLIDYIMEANQPLEEIIADNIIDEGIRYDQFNFIVKTPQTRVNVIGSVHNTPVFREALIADFVSKILAIEDKWQKGTIMYSIMKDTYGYVAKLTHDPILITDLKQDIVQVGGQKIVDIFGGEFPFFDIYKEADRIYYNIVR